MPDYRSLRILRIISTAFACCVVVEPCLSRALDEIWSARGRDVGHLSPSYSACEQWGTAPTKTELPTTTITRNPQEKHLARVSAATVPQVATATFSLWPHWRRRATRRETHSLFEIASVWVRLGSDLGPPSPLVGYVTLKCLKLLERSTVHRPACRHVG